MGRASHKLAGSYISIGSTLPAIELRRITEQVATATLPTGLHRGAKARIHTNPHSANALNFWIGWRKPMMIFSVWIDDHESGGGQLCSQIDNFRTSQDAIGGFLPVGPKQLDGWNWYLNFMLDLKAAVLRADPVAEIDIVEAAG
jgi:hypothetical protein